MWRNVFHVLRRLDLQCSSTHRTFVPHRSLHTTYPTQDASITVKAPTKRTKSKARPKTTKKRLADLPSQLLVEGIPVPPLAPWSGTTTATGGASSSTKSKMDAAYEVAVSDGLFPRTPLAKEIFCNMTRFQGDMLLTRVGMFYEVSRPSCCTRVC